MVSEHTRVQSLPPAADTDEAAPVVPPPGSRYVPLFWRIFIPNATVLGVAVVVLAAEPPNGRIVVLTAGLATMLAINLVTMRRAFAPFARLVEVMRDIDPLRPGHRVEVIGPESEVTLVAASFNEMLDRLEAERRDSARRELFIQQAERRAVARELHDELGQNLTALALQLDRVAKGASEDATVEAARARDAALEAVESVRGLARKLQPDVLDELGLGAALADLCGRLSLRTGLPIDFEIADPLPHLDADVSLVVYRVVQEGLTNVLRHANAGHAQVSLWHEGTNLHVAVEDDGVGMDFSDDVPADLLRSLRERVLLIGGTLEVATTSGRGVRLEVCVPGAAS